MSSRTADKRPARRDINSRKPVQAVSTDLSHYDRSNPFTAMDTLRKLLSQLPNNPGAHQYKMNPAEHKLAMHLLTIVEPYVGPTISHYNITRMPTEILDNIAFYVDLKRDLLSLALTCHRMRDIVSPRHSNYRVVKAKVSLTRVWRHLTVFRGLARNVRRLEIMDERSSDAEKIIPSDIPTTEADVESMYDGLDLSAQQEKSLVSAVAEMHGLQSFKWSRTHSLISIESLWPTLLNCPQLSLVDLNDNAMFLDQDPEEEEGDSHADEGTILMGMTTISVKSNKNLRPIKDPRLVRISGLLESCPNLKKLNITYIVPPRSGSTYPIADGFYSYGRWKNLTSLALDGLWCTPQGLDNLATFLSEHDNLETLHFKSTGTSTAALVLPQNALPRLKELESSREFASAILSCKSDALQPLEILKGIDLSGSESDRPFFENLARAGDKISRIELAAWNQMEDLRKLLQHVPNLIWLDVGNGHTLNKAIKAYGPDDWAKVLMLVPAIETFFGVKLFRQIPDIPVDDMGASDRSKAKRNAEIASNLARQCLKLRRLQHWEDGGSKIIVLLRRDPERRYKVVRVEQENGNSWWAQ